MKKLTIAVAVCASVVLAACGDGVVPSKINMLLVDVGTIDTVAKTEKFMAAQDKVLLKSPPKPSAAENFVDPDVQKRSVTLNWITGVAEYMADKKRVDEENARRRKILEGLRNGIQGTSENRMVVVAKDYLASGLEEYSDYITVVDRSDASLQEVEKAIANKDQEEVAPATLFLSVTLGDIVKTSKTVPLGDTLVQKSTYTRKATAKVSDFNNVRVFSCDVTAKSELRRTASVAMSGQEDEIANKLIEDAMRQIAKKVGEKFVKEFVVKVSIPKKWQDDISPDSVELYLDRATRRIRQEDGSFVEEVVVEGVSVAPNEPFRALSCNHAVTIVCGDDELKVNQMKVSLGANKRSATVVLSKKIPLKSAG